MTGLNPTKRSDALQSCPVLPRRYTTQQSRPGHHSPNLYCPTIPHQKSTQLSQPILPFRTLPNANEPNTDNPLLPSHNTTNTYEPELSLTAMPRRSTPLLASTQLTLPFPYCRSIPLQTNRHSTNRNYPLLPKQTTAHTDGAKQTYQRHYCQSAT